jgi:hypothetical protein
MSTPEERDPLILVETSLNGHIVTMQKRRSEALDEGYDVDSPDVETVPPVVSPRKRAQATAPTDEIVTKRRK